MKIWKYELSFADKQTLHIPKKYKILDLQVQRGIPCIWVVVPDDTSEQCEFDIFIVGTGHDVPEEAIEHLGTIQVGAFVWHFFLGDLK